MKHKGGATIFAAHVFRDFHLGFLVPIGDGITDLSIIRKQSSKKKIAAISHA